jgi:hypothetical protein
VGVPVRAGQRNRTDERAQSRAVIQCAALELRAHVTRQSGR